MQPWGAPFVQVAREKEQTHWFFGAGAGPTRSSRPPSVQTGSHRVQTRLLLDKTGLHGGSAVGPHVPSSAHVVRSDSLVERTRSLLGSMHAHAPVARRLRVRAT